ncbi:MAG: hypothetical protein KKD18_01945 [Nanoarchaeota archaeon]|nr:hypothetical protein [Nanoarchaeota archaeon]MBU0977154.1 hypothetical protein [Nanoarchaeota archaeon]
MPMRLYRCTNSECGAEGNYFTDRDRPVVPLCKECGEQTLQRIYHGQAPTIRTSDKTKEHRGSLGITEIMMRAHGL